MHSRGSVTKLTTRREAISSCERVNRLTALDHTQSQTTRQGHLARPDSRGGYFRGRVPCITLRLSCLIIAYQRVVFFQNTNCFAGRPETEKDLCIITQVFNSHWQPISGLVYNLHHTIIWHNNHCKKNILRFNPVRIGEWLNDLLAREIVITRMALSQYVGMSRTRVGQFLALAGLPVETKAKLRGMHDLNEYQTRQFLGKGTVDLRQTCQGENPKFTTRIDGANPPH